MINVMLQPLDGLEAGFRYTDISNRLYGPADLSGSQSMKDKSFEIKARLWNESAWLPAMAAGIRDLGLVYRLAPGLDLSLGRERGTTWSVGFTLYTDLSRLAIPKLTDKPAPPVALQAPPTAPDWPKTGQDIQALTQWQVQQIQRRDNTLILDLTESDTAYHPPRIDKAMAVLQRDAPADITHIELRHRASGDVLTVDHIDREAWLQLFAQPERTSTPAPAVTHSYPPAHSLPPGRPPADHRAKTLQPHARHPPQSIHWRPRRLRALPAQFRAQRSVGAAG